MTLKKLNTALIFILVLASTQAKASPTPPQDICQIEGEILAVNDRQAQNAMGSAVSYKDIKVEVRNRKVYEKNGFEACSAINEPAIMIYQLRNDVKETPKTGTKIRALTKYFGDEFLIGNWLYQIEAIQ